MRPIKYLACSMILGAMAAWAAPQPIRVMTYNIRYDNPEDGPNGWLARRDSVASTVRFHKVDILCIQEGLTHQVQFLAERLGYSWFGVGRSDGKAAGEYAAIFYDPKRFERLDGDHFWLSPTPEIPGKGWDAASIRIATWVRLKDKRDGSTFFVFNTHLDDQGERARLEGTKLLKARIQGIASGKSVLLAGDFNSTEKEPPYALLTKNPEAGSSPLQDSLLRSETPHHGPQRTFSGFSVRAGLAGERIDHVFTSSDVRILFHGTLSDFKEDERFPSDHLPVLVEVILGGKP